jgi:hypothetical protein
MLHAGFMQPDFGGFSQVWQVLLLLLLTLRVVGSKETGTFQHICCRSSGVEHSLGKGEVGSSNLPGSTTRFR